MCRAIETSVAGVRDHKELNVWKLSNELCLRVRHVIARPDFRRHHGLRVQIEDAAESPPPNIAEGFARYLPRDNARFVRIAAGSLNELITHLDRALAWKLISPDEHAELTSLAARARGAAARYAAYLQRARPPR